MPSTGIPGETACPKSPVRSPAFVGRAGQHSRELRPNDKAEASGIGEGAGFYRRLGSVDRDVAQHGRVPRKAGSIREHRMSSDGAGNSRSKNAVNQPLTGRIQRPVMVPRRGLEPPRPCDRQHLKLVRLPIPPSGHGVGARRYGGALALSMIPAVARRPGRRRARSRCALVLAGMAGLGRRSRGIADNRVTRWPG
jgi:hypothetical protein